MKRKPLVVHIPLSAFCALMMGAAVAFFFFAMPQALLERGVIATGLPNLIAAASPPLGGTARTLVVTTFAILSGGLTWGAIMLVEMLGRLRCRSARTMRESELAEIIFPDPAAPQPAAARRPIFAATDLPMAEKVEEADVPRSEALDLSPFEPEEAPVAPAPPEPAFEPLDVSFDDVLELVDVAPDEPAPPTRDMESLSIAELMARLEAGAERRAARVTASPASATSPARKVDDAFDGALRSALEDLQRMSGR